MDDTTYALAPDAVFWTLQGEGPLLGEPMVFVRLAGCPVNCPQCDTDYSVASRATAKEIARRAVEVATPGTRWAFVTGGEPAAFDLMPLFAELRRAGFLVAVVTSGLVAAVPVGSATGGCDFLSVSPHRLDASWVVRRGDSVNLVPGLNGLKLADAEGIDWSGFAHRFVTPNSREPGSVAACIEWVRTHAGWRLGCQCHLVWGVA